MQLEDFFVIFARFERLIGASKTSRYLFRRKLSRMFEQQSVKSDRVRYIDAYASQRIKAPIAFIPHQQIGKDKFDLPCEKSLCTVFRYHLLVHKFICQLQVVRN